MDGRGDAFHVAGQPDPTKPDKVVDLYMVTPGYFQTMGIDRLKGRDFAGEGANSPKVAIVNETFVKQFFGEKSHRATRDRHGRNLRDRWAREEQ